MLPAGCCSAVLFGSARISDGDSSRVSGSKSSSCSSRSISSSINNNNNMGVSMQKHGRAFKKIKINTR